MTRTPARPAPQPPTAQPQTPESAGLPAVGHPRCTDGTPAASSVGEPRISRRLLPLVTARGKKVGLAIALLLAAALPATGSAATPPNLAKAIEEHRKLAQESPTPGVLNDLANLLVLAGQRGEAESIYRRVLALDAANDEAQFNLGLLLQSRGDLDEAEDLYLAVTERRPGNPWPFYQLGAIYESRAQRLDAIEAYATALALDPQLYFADVNPQVLRNDLLTESILEAARRRENRSLAPMQYSRPREITQMLLSLPAMTGNAAEVAAPTPEPQSGDDETEGD